ncbi:hypothetical protein NDU88_001269 [Pleurodeles waltl]|uniref:Uncharacterized protein n=1 Tax=Pleurodeles waltl TaxID=8319 RepID=A0AAV7NC39_PLEWA|nr:hypothetical protein NDU88_001269 [Pleurodeles waltl]
MGTANYGVQCFPWIMGVDPEGILSKAEIMSRIENTRDSKDFSLPAPGVSGEAHTLPCGAHPVLGALKREAGSLRGGNPRTGSRAGKRSMRLRSAAEETTQRKENRRKVPLVSGIDASQAVFDAHSPVRGYF